MNTWVLCAQSHPNYIAAVIKADRLAALLQ